LVTNRTLTIDIKNYIITTYLCYHLCRTIGTNRNRAIFANIFELLIQTEIANMPWAMPFRNVISNLQRKKEIRSSRSRFNSGGISSSNSSSNSSSSSSSSNNCITTSSSVSNSINNSINNMIYNMCIYYILYTIYYHDTVTAYPDLPTS
jgi:hypothetical protein